MSPWETSQVLMHTQSGRQWPLLLLLRCTRHILLSPRESIYFQGLGLSEVSGGRAVAEGWPSTVTAGKPPTVSLGSDPFPREGQRKAVGGWRERWGLRHPRLPGCHSSGRPGLAGRDAPSRGSRGRGGGAGLRAPAPPSITWPETHKNNSFGQARDFRKGTGALRRQPLFPWRTVSWNRSGG